MSSGFASWFEAAERGDVCEVQSRLDSCRGIRDEKGRTALMIAVQANQIAVATLLTPLEAKNLDPEGRPAIIYAINEDSYELCSLLAEHEGHMLAPDGLTVLSYAAATGRNNAVRALLGTYGGSPDRLGFTPLDYAVRSMHFEALQTLIASDIFSAQDISTAIANAQQGTYEMTASTRLRERELDDPNNISTLPIAIDDACQNSQGPRDGDRSSLTLPNLLADPVDRSQCLDVLTEALRNCSGIGSVDTSTARDLATIGANMTVSLVGQGSAVSLNSSTLDVSACTARATVLEDMSCIGQQLSYGSQDALVAGDLADLPKRASIPIAPTVSDSEDSLPEDLMNAYDRGSGLDDEDSGSRQAIRPSGGLPGGPPYERKVSQDAQAIDCSKTDGFTEDSCSSLHVPMPRPGVSVCCTEGSADERIMDSLLKDNFHLADSALSFQQLNVSSGIDVITRANAEIAELEGQMKILLAELADADTQVGLLEGGIENSQENSELGEENRETLERLQKQMALKSCVITNLQTQLTVSKDLAIRLSDLVSKAKTEVISVQSELQGRDNIIERLREQLTSIPDFIPLEPPVLREEAFAQTDPGVEADVAALRSELKWRKTCYLHLEAQLMRREEQIERLNGALYKDPMGAVQNLKALEERVVQLTEELRILKESAEQTTATATTAVANTVLDTIEDKDAEIICLRSTVSELKDRLRTTETALECAAGWCPPQSEQNISSSLPSLFSPPLQGKSDIAPIGEASFHEEALTEIDLGGAHTAALEAQVSTLQGRCSDLERLLESRKDEIRVLQAQLASSACIEVAEKVEKPSPCIDQMSQTDAVEIPSNDSETERLADQVQALRLQLFDAEKANTALEEKLNVYAVQGYKCPRCEILHIQNVTLTEEAEARKLTNKQLSFELRAYSEQLIALRATTTTLRSQLSSKERELDTYVKEMQRVARQNSRLKGDLARLSEDYTSPHVPYGKSPGLRSQAQGLGGLDGPSYGTPTYSSRSPGSLPSLRVEKYATQLSDIKAFAPLRDPPPDKPLNRKPRGIPPTAYADLTIPAVTQRPSPPPERPMSHPDLGQASRRIMAASLIDALAMSGYTTESVRKAGY
ncbi:Ankyrin repeat protein 1 [Giardia muris]|uniref:Ankyrin repeat protein 1 n=1 Tax=Giardia muris TaxID=5742 RepID=A0A4Z1SZM5_GIAMU|nr:Ankyrin repeat protein 1 [Giardia muris]|eukprot:TNJ27103.1 Ankyrin repeat protein 1 [Giardia muris]